MSSRPDVRSLGVVAADVRGRPREVVWRGPCLLAFLLVLSLVGVAPSSGTDGGRGRGISTASAGDGRGSGEAAFDALFMGFLENVGQLPDREIHF